VEIVARCATDDKQLGGLQVKKYGHWRSGAWSKRGLLAEKKSTDGEEV